MTKGKDLAKGSIFLSIYGRGPKWESKKGAMGRQLEEPRWGARLTEPAPLPTPGMPGQGGRKEGKERRRKERGREERGKAQKPNLGCNGESPAGGRASRRDAPPPCGGIPSGGGRA